MRDAELMQRVYVRTIVDLAGIERIEYAVAGEEDDLYAVLQRAVKHDDVTVRGGHGLLVIGNGQRFDVGAADDCDFHVCSDPPLIAMFLCFSEPLSADGVLSEGGF